ncbi:MAG: gamma-glutamylcyclotransferase [Candidatus Niameybacter stercoravium]|nr:gamma-glutamylcyclotransferase [Candidatus Niameybacter stercoravium]
MDKFFTQNTCDRCGDTLNAGRIMSMFNTDCICLKCKDKEQLDPQYNKALQADREQIQKGNYNYKGIRGK